jgi:hypothetical protein
MAGTPNALRTVYVRQIGGGDVQGGDAAIQFWSYSQGQHALMGDSVDWFHIDEEPRDAATSSRRCSRVRRPATRVAAGAAS